MKTALILTALVLATPSLPLAAEQTWTGKISDSACGAKHEEAAEGQGVMADRDCTQACVRGGARYQPGAGGQWLGIAQHDNNGPATHAGDAGEIPAEPQGNATPGTQGTI